MNKLVGTEIATKMGKLALEIGGDRLEAPTATMTLAGSGNPAASFPAALGGRAAGVHSIQRNIMGMVWLHGLRSAEEEEAVVNFGLSGNA
jgi:hypothetical protein